MAKPAERMAHRWLGKTDSLTCAPYVSLAHEGVKDDKKVEIEAAKISAVHDPS
jgi:hypothetical protein